MDCDQSLAEKLVDLSIKYESLEQKYNVVELENNHYREHVS